MNKKIFDFASKPIVVKPESFTFDTVREHTGAFDQPLCPHPDHKLQAFHDQQKRWGMAADVLRRVRLQHFPYDVKFHVERCLCTSFCTHIGIEIVAMVFERNTGAPMPLVAHEQAESQAPYHILEAIRRGLHRLVTHEVDEALLLSGMRVFDPHKKGM